MAISVSPSVYSNPELFGSGSHWADNLSPSEPMTSIMSYQYPPLSSMSGDVDMSHPAYAPTYNTPPPQPSPIGMTNIQGSSQHLKKAVLTLEGSFSTPAAGMVASSTSDSQQQQSQLTIVGEKKRNKLGYHRTSVACGHCRRRKIRCIPAPSDAQGRCANCIRLKKECSFYPVDQTPATDRAKQSTKSSSSTKATTASLSPADSSGNMNEMPGNQPFSPVPQPLSSGPTPTLKSESVDVFTSDVKTPLASSTDRSFEFSGQPAVNWAASDAGHSPNSKPVDLNATWRGYPPESPMSAQFSPYGAPPPSATWTSGSSEPGSRDDMPWANYPPPVRSMSYGGEPLASHHPGQYPPVPQGRQFERRASNLSDVYTTSVGVPVAGMDTSAAPGMEAVPLSAGAVPPPGFGSWSQPPQAPTYTYPTWGYGEAGVSQSMDPGQHLAENDPQAGLYYTR